MKPDYIICHSKYVLDIAMSFGWKAGARYTNLRDVKHLNSVHFIDIDWKNYDYDRHLHAVREKRPALTVARDVLDATHLDEILREAEVLGRYCETVIVVPKDPALMDEPRLSVPYMFRLGYSVPTRYGGTEIPTTFFRGPVHLLGGRPDVQRELARQMDVQSIDGNRLTLDAKFGDYFDGQRFRPHPEGGYRRCVTDSIRNVKALWETDTDHD
ncbi:DUF6610 family protein [Qipengyuania soli]|uniref:Uncharacterized protein n=1 Tax=Qipengyuania soli TaxID=2782568 RepID=A0A7S8F2D0_9SPHN|nr:DUF6610 family protein [Qipengyuania soli]QPC97765.1 hypothetical protein IRL76_07555 [Qipengyuania soli]